ncbi:hypothetical protein PACTADRAFT_33673 [Pachysolen tannophilus NRRL Y-2460]|uniref:Sfi1 spindle body domain-containing protein n=1 Tax=Pachysolen tannophilus NRRL Y-2460 TaxID=669874 RepID=A0A1E4TXP0_PACTA|nr:hypothetical protein PACTADRAFT_33673 [Pachysolen tannophilus NRRL Y-2460]
MDDKAPTGQAKHTEASLNQLVASIINLYVDYSNYTETEVYAIINHRLSVIRANWKQFLNVPPILDDISIGELIINNKQISNRRIFKYTLNKNDQEPVMTISDAMKKVSLNANSKNSVNQLNFDKLKNCCNENLKKNSSKNVNDCFAIILLEEIGKFISLLEKDCNSVESELVKLIFDSFIYEYNYNLKIKKIFDKFLTDSNTTNHDPTTEFSIENNQLEPLNLQSNDPFFQRCYENMLLRVLTESTNEDDNAILKDKIWKISNITLQMYKVFIRIRYFFNNDLMLNFNNSIINITCVFVDENSSQLGKTIKTYFNKNPIFNELEIMLEEYKKTKKTSKSVPHPIKDQIHTSKLIKNSKIIKRDYEENEYRPHLVKNIDSLKEIEKLLTLLKKIVNAFKNYELHERPLYDDTSNIVDPDYYEFKFPEIFKCYVDILLHDGNINTLINDVYYNNVKKNVLKYENETITHKCWDLELHNLCKVMVGEPIFNKDPKIIQTTTVHREALFKYTKDKKLKRKFLKIWFDALGLKEEEKEFLALYNKVILTRKIFNLWNKKLSKLKFLESQADNYKTLYDSKLFYEKWANHFRIYQSLDLVSSEIVQSKFLVLWVSKFNKYNCELDLQYDKFCKFQKINYIQKFIAKFESVQTLNSKIKILENSKKKLFFEKLLLKYDERTLILRNREAIYLQRVKHTFFARWKAASDLKKLESETFRKIELIRKNAFFQYWNQRYAEQKLRKKFSSTLNKKILRRYFLNLVIIKENKFMADCFARERLLEHYFKVLQIQLNLKRFEKRRNYGLLSFFLRLWKLETRSSLFQFSRNENLKYNIFKLWVQKDSNRKIKRSENLKDLEIKSLGEFEQRRKLIILKSFLTIWEDKTIELFEKKQLLQHNYELSSQENFVTPVFYQWLNKYKKIEENKVKAKKFNEELLLTNYLNILIDRFNEIQYLNQLCNERIYYGNLNRLNSFFKKISLKYLKIKNNENLSLEFKKKLEVTILKNFLTIWKDFTLEKHDKNINTEISFNDNENYTSPLNRKNSRKLDFQPQMISSTPLLLNDEQRNGSTEFLSPSKDSSFTERPSFFKTPRSSMRTPRSIRINPNINVDSQSYKRSQIDALKKRFYGVKNKSPTPSAKKITIDNNNNFAKVIGGENLYSSTNNTFDDFNPKSEDIPISIPPQPSFLSKIDKDVIGKGSRSFQTQNNHSDKSQEVESNHEETLYGNTNIISVNMASTSSPINNTKPDPQLLKTLFSSKKQRFQPVNYPPQEDDFKTKAEQNTQTKNNNNRKFFENIDSPKVSPIPDLRQRMALYLNEIPNLNLAGHETRSSDKHDIEQNNTNRDIINRNKQNYSNTRSSSSTFVDSNEENYLSFEAERTNLVKPSPPSLTRPASKIPRLFNLPSTSTASNKTHPAT